MQTSNVEREVGGGLGVKAPKPLLPQSNFSGEIQKDCSIAYTNPESDVFGLCCLLPNSRPTVMSNLERKNYHIWKWGSVLGCSSAAQR